MRVFIAGGGGAIGAQLIPVLTDAGYEVTATTRTEEKTTRIRSLGAEPVVLDALDEGATREAVRAAAPDVVVHQMTALTGFGDLRRWDRGFAQTNLLRTKGTDILLAAAEEAGAHTFVAQSFAG